MVNPFDRDFFKFFIGFICILCFSFGVLFVVGYYSNVVSPQARALQK